MRVCLISMTVIEDDPRVRRQGDALLGAGHEVTAIGIPGARSNTPGWPVQHVAGRRCSTFGNVDLAGRAALASAVPPISSQLFWSFGYNRAFLEAAMTVDADLYLANDWWVLPIAARVALARGASYAYDTHEYAVEENLQNHVWRATMPRYIDRIERESIGGARFVTTVAGGIADRMLSRYGLSDRPSVIRNVPAFTPVAGHLALPPYTVLYQGIFHSNRRLDILIDSVRLWRSEFRLVVRGLGSPSETERLQSMAARSDGRVVIEPPVPMTEMVSCASAADIGVFALPNSNPQADYCLPNKLFEYAMAGLALCVSDVPEMRSVVEQYDLGFLIEAVTPEGIAGAINAFRPDTIDRFRANSLLAAPGLSWDKEQINFLKLVDLVSSP